MANRLPIGYLYVSRSNLDRMESFIAVSGDSERQLVNQYIRGWLGRNRDRLWHLAIADARERGVPLDEWGRLIIKKGVKALPGTGLAHPPDEPLVSVPVGEPRIKRRVNWAMLGNQNVALLRIAVFYSGLRMVDFTSRIVAEHLSRNWDKLYSQQVLADNVETWPELAKLLEKLDGD